MPSALEQATSSSSDIEARSNSLSGNLALRLWTWRSHDGAPPLDAEGAEGAEGAGPVSACFRALRVVGRWRTPARWPGRRSLPFTTAFFRPALWSRCARPTTLAFPVRRFEAECMVPASVDADGVVVDDR